MFKRIRDFPRRLLLAWRLARDPDLLRRLDEYAFIEVDTDAMKRLVTGMTAPDEKAEDYIDPTTIVLTIKSKDRLTFKEADQILNESRRAPANSIDVLEPKKIPPQQVFGTYDLENLEDLFEATE